MRRSRVRGPGHGRDAGVSPVIGMVLILAISVLGIVAVTNWGLPAILAMQQNVEMRGVLNEFGTLDGSLQKLIAGTTGQTTSKWQPSIGKGAVDVSPTGERWLVTVDVHATTDVEWDSMSDTDNKVEVIIAATTVLDSPKLHVSRWVEGVETEIKANLDGACATAAWTPAATLGQELYLVTNQTSGCSQVNLDNVVLSFSLRNEPGAVTVLHEAHLADVGRIHWNSLAGTPQHIYHSNGAIFSGGDNTTLVAQSALAVSPVRDFTNSAGVESKGLFARILKVNGTASFSGVEGGARTSVFLAIVCTWTMGTIEDGDKVSIYVFGETRDVVYAALKDSAAGYDFDEDPTPVKHVQYQESVKPFRFSVAYTFVEVQR